MKPSAGALLSLRSSLVAAEPLGVDLVVGTVGADFVEDLVKTGAQLVVALADGKAVVFRLQRASEILCPWDNRSPPNGCIQ